MKTKRILWTIAVLLALSFLGAMVLHKHEEPKVIGNLSKEDVSKISNAALKHSRGWAGMRIRIDWQRKNLREMPSDLLDYLSVKIVSIETFGDCQAIIKLEPRRTQIQIVYTCIRNGSNWKVQYTDERPRHF